MKSRPPLSGNLEQLLPSGELSAPATQVPPGQAPLWQPWAIFVREMVHLRRRRRTLISIGNCLQSLLRHGGILSLEQATADALKGYLRKSFETRGWKPWTYNTHRSKLNSFFRFLWEEGLIPENPFRRIRIMGLSDVYRPTLTEIQNKRIVGHLLTRHPNRLITHRNVVFVHLLSVTGCRVSEALGMKITDLDFGNRTLRIPATKGAKPRLIHISRALLDHLVRYLEFRHRIGRTEDWLFVSASQKGGWTYSGVRKMLAQLSEDLGFKVLCHAFRRYAVTRLAEESIPVDRISELMGHTNTRTTRIYINSCTPVLLRPCTDTLSRVLEPVVSRPSDVSPWLPTTGP